MELGPLGDGSRPFLISANREGVVSCGGYLALYLAGIELGLLLFRRKRLLMCCVVFIGGLYPRVVYVPTV